jgi:hypothetical protein
MKIEYTLTLADYDAALQLHRRQNLTRQVSWIFMYRVLPTVGFLILAWALIAGLALKSGFTQNPPVTLFFPFIFLLLPLINRNLVRQQFKQTFPPAARSLFLEMGDEGVICNNPGVSESKFSWNAIVAFVQNEKVAMLYIAKGRFLFFPTAVLSQGQHAELNELVVRHVTKRG